MIIIGKNFKTLIRKNVFLFITELSLGGASTKNTSTLSVTNPSAGIIISSSTTLLISIAILITNEQI